MEKIEGNRSQEQPDEIQDPEIYQEVESDHLQPSRQLPINKDPTQNVLEHDFLQTGKNDESLIEEVQKHDTDVKQKVEKSVLNFPVRTHDSTPIIQQETAEVHQECVELPEDEMLEVEKNIKVQTRTENLEEILRVPAKDSVPTAEPDSNDAAQEEWNIIAKNEDLEANVALKQRKASILNSQKEGLQQSCEASEETVKVKEQDIITQKEIETKVNFSEAPTEAGAAQNDVQEREKNFKKMLADFFKNQNQVTTQQRTDSREEMSVAPAQIAIPTAKHDSNNAVDQELERIDKEQLGTNSALQQRSDQPRTPSISSTKESLHQPCEVSDETIKVGKEQVMQQSSVTSDNVSKAPAEVDAKNQKLIRREQEMRKTVAGNCSQQKEINHQETEIYRQNDTQSIDIPEDIESQKPKDTVTYRELQEIRREWTLLHGDASPEEVLARSQASKQDENIHHPETKENKKLDSGSQPSKGYVTLRRLQFGVITAPPKKSGFARVSIGASERPQKTKDYVTSPFRESIETVHSSNTKDFVTSRPRGPDNETVRTCREPTETVRTCREPTETVRTCREPTETVGTCREPTETACSSKTKDYVTVRPRRSDNETANTKIAKGFSYASKDYVTIHSIEQNATPPDLQPSVWSVSENAYGSGSSTQMHVPPQSLQGSVPTPKSKEPSHVPLGMQQLEGGEKAPLPNRVFPRQDLTPQTQRRRQVSESDFPLVPFAEVGSETAEETNEPRLQKIRRISLTGIRSFLQRVHDLFNTPESHTTNNKSSVDCILLYIIFALCFVVVIYFVTIFVKILFDNSVSNVTSTSPDSHLNMDTIVTDIKYRQSESLDSKVSIPMTRLDIIDIDSNDIFTTPVADIKVNIINTLADKDGEIIPVMNDNVNTNEINSESNMATLVTNLGNKLLDFGATTPVNDFDVNIITHVTNWEINVINPFTYSDNNFINPTTCSDNFINLVTDMGNNDKNPITDMDDVTNPDTELDINAAVLNLDNYTRDELEL